MKSAGLGLNQLVQSDTGHTHTHTLTHSLTSIHSFTCRAKITHMDDTHVISPELTDERKAITLFSLPHHHCNQHTRGGGGMEVAILRARASVLFEGDFGLAGVVIGYTYKCLFLPLPHDLFKVSLLTPPSLFLAP